jgi:hypothetical protein
MAGTIERTLALKLIGDVSGIRRDMKPAERSVGRFTRVLGKASGHYRRLAGSITSWGKAFGGAIILGGIEKVVSGLGDAFKGFKSGQRVAAQMRRTWKNLGLDGRAYGRVLDQVTQSTLRLGTSDDEAVAAFTRSIQRTKDYQQSLRELTIAQDLVANGSAPNLESAFKIIQQAGKGSARVVDRFGLTAETAGGRVAQLGRQVRGAAKEKARLDPFGRLFNRMAEDAESIVGAFAEGDFAGFVKGLQGLGQTVSEALFGRTGTGPHKKHVDGLVDQFGKWGKKLADGIIKGISEVNWGQALGDVLNKAVGALSAAGANGTLSTLATIGAVIAAGIFAVDLFITAASAVFSSPRWLLGAGAKAAGAMVGLAFRGAMFAAELFLDAAALVFQASKWVAGTVAGKAAAAAGGAVGIVFRGAMFVGELVADAFMGALNLLEGLAGETARSVGAKVGAIFRVAMFTATLMAERLRLALIALANSTKLGNLATALGRSVGAKVAAGFLGFLTGAWFISQVAQALYNAGGLGKVDEGLNNPANPNQRPLPDWRPGWWPRFAAGTASAPRGWGWVGERGPELVRFRGGEQVLSNRASRDAMGGGSVVNLNVSVNAPIAADGARVGAEIAAYLDRFFSRGGRLRHMPAR